MRILIVDDELISANKLNLLLTPHGTCLMVETGQQAIDAFIQAHREDAPFGLISLDINLPDMTGQDVLETIRRWETDNGITNTVKETRILMVTAMSDRKSIISSFEKGCEGYLSKPFNSEKLKKSLDDLGIG